MKHQLFYLLVAFLLCQKSLAQCPDSIVFSTQAQINSFPTDYPGCTAIQGDVTISGTGITNLNGLIGLASVGGNLTIDSNIMLSNLTGLNSLKTIGGDLAITKNYALLSLNGLNNLASIGGSLYIGKGIGNPFQTPGNDLLTNLSGLESLDSIGGDFFIKDNASLVNLSGIENIAFVGGTFDVTFNGNLTALANLGSLHALGGIAIFSNPSLNSLSGLDSVRSVSGLVIIWGTSQLTNLVGLNNLDSIGGSLIITSSPNLADLTGLDKLRFIGGSLEINDFFGAQNLVLTSLNGLNSLNHIEDSFRIGNNPLLSDITALDHSIFIGKNLSVDNNPLLSICAVQSICDYLDDPPGTATIKANAPGCNFPTEVFAVCKGFSNVIQGTLYWDDGNCLYDSTEQTLKQWLVKAESDSLTFYAVTDTAGHFSILVGTGTYTLSAVLLNGLWAHCDSIQVTFDQFYQAVDTAIGILDTVSCPLMAIDIGTPRLRHCFDNFYYVTYCNKGAAVADSAFVELIFDPGLIVDTSTLPDPWEPLVGNAFRVHLGDVPPLTCGSFSVKVTVDCDSTAVGERKCVMAHIYPDSLCLPAPGWDGSDIVVTARCSGDTVYFTIQNIGIGDMEEFAEFIIIEETVMRPPEDFKLEAGTDTIVFVANAANKTWRLEAEQDSAHPFSKVASVTIEGCPEFTNFSVFLQYPQDEAQPYVAIDCHPIVASWDPNDKQAFPEGLGDDHSIRDNTPLEYLIRFQNTGTDTAFHVVVRDTLSPFLDIETVRTGASSHPYQFEIVPNNVLKLTFDDIMLPDSNVNEPASNGFVQFSVRQKSSPVNPPGTRIENKAAIYFDFNPPVLTDTVFHTVAKPFETIVMDTTCGPTEGGPIDTAQFSYFNVLTVFIDTCTMLTKVPSGYSGFHLFPNPTGSDLTLRFTQTTHDQVTVVEIRDATGRLRQVLLPPLTGGSSASLTLPVSGLSGGMYYLTIRSANRIWTGRFVKLE